jgi:hypothetical protein
MTLRAGAAEITNDQCVLQAAAGTGSSPSTFAFLVDSSFPGVALRFGAAAAGFFVVSVFGFAGDLAFLTAGLVSDAGFAFAIFGEVVFFGFAAATAFLTVALALVPAALTAAVDDFVASRGERRVGPVDAFLAGIFVDDVLVWVRREDKKSKARDWRVLVYGFWFGEGGEATAAVVCL